MDIQAARAELMNVQAAMRRLEELETDKFRTLRSVCPHEQLVWAQLYTSRDWMCLTCGIDTATWFSQEADRQIQTNFNRRWEGLYFSDYPEISENDFMKYRRQLPELVEKTIYAPISDK